jgi:very-short-patch-repair endonuclease
VAQVRGLRDAGHSAYVVNQALARDALVRVRRDWVALPAADPELVAAARVGVVLTCITQARRLGLWVLREDRPHVAAPPHGSIAETSAHVHWAAPVVPRHPERLVDSVENALALVAVCQPFESALAIWESALSKGLIDRGAVRRLDLPAAAHRLLDAAVPWSESGLESFVVPRLRWMRLAIVPQVWIAGHRVDFLIGERLVLQVDGGHHVGAQRSSDIALDARLMLLGYHVIRVGYEQVIERWEEVQDLVMRAVAQGLHRANR